MQRVIVPILIESHNLNIKSLQSLNTLKDEQPELYKIIALSGDAERLYHAYAKTEEKEEAILLRQNLTKDLPDPFSQPNIYLHGDVYTTQITEIKHQFELRGYHRQKSLIDLEGKSIFFENDVTLSYCTLRNGSITIKQGIKLNLKGVILDNVPLIAQAQTQLVLNDVEVSGVTGHGIHLKKDALIQEYTNVSFWDIHKRFLIEEASSETTSLVFDNNDADTIIEFFETSTVLAVRLEKSFSPKKRKNVNFKQSVKFINLQDKPLRFEADIFEVEKDIILEGNFKTKSNFKVHELSKIQMRLSEFEGEIDINDCNLLDVSHTAFRRNSAQLISEDSKIILRNCVLQNTEKLFTFSGSAMEFENCIIKNCENLFKIKEAFYGDDEQIKTSEPLDCVIGFGRNTIISASTNLIQSKLVSKMSFHQCSIQESVNVFSLSNSHLNIANMNAINNNLIFKLSKTNLSVASSEFSQGEMAISIDEASSATLDTCNFTQMKKAGILSKNSQLHLFNSNFSYCDSGVILDEGESNLYHQDCSFTDNISRNILIGYGSNVIDINEEENQQELEPCHIA